MEFEVSWTLLSLLSFRLNWSKMLFCEIQKVEGSPHKAANFLGFEFSWSSMSLRTFCFHWKSWVWTFWSLLSTALTQMWVLSMVFCIPWPPPELCKNSDFIEGWGLISVLWRNRSNKCRYTRRHLLWGLGSHDHCGGWKVPWFSFYRQVASGTVQSSPEGMRTSRSCCQS